MASVNISICILHLELVAYKTEDICQLMIDGFPKKYQVRYKVTITFMYYFFLVCFFCLFVVVDIR